MPDALTILLAVTLALSLVAVLVLAILLGRSRRALAEARRRQSAGAVTGPATRAVKAGQWALRTAVGTAVKVREQGARGLLLSSIEDLTGIALADRREIERIVRPDGTVTVFFSDIEGSTALNEELGDDGWVRLLAGHDKLVREHVERNSGHVVKTQGDGFMVVFGEPEQGVEAAAGIQAELAAATRKWLRRTPIRVRIGLHRGPVISRDDDYFGVTVAMAARVAALADGGEVLVTDGVREAAPERPFSLHDEAAELRGIGGTHRLWLLDT